MSQAEVFLAGEADAYYQRNAAHNAAYDPAGDIVAQVIDLAGWKPRDPEAILDLGCSSGERLSYLGKRYKTNRWGMDASGAAISAASERDPQGCWLVRDWTAETPDPEVDDFGLVITSYVWHWVDRSKLLRAMAAVHHYLAPGGLLVINDWVETRDVPYHHRPGVMTYKRDYPAMFLATGLYRERCRLAYTYRDSQERCACVALERIA